MQNTNFAAEKLANITVNYEKLGVHALGKNYAFLHTSENKVLQVD